MDHVRVRCCRETAHHVVDGEHDGGDAHSHEEGNAALQHEREYRASPHYLHGHGPHREEELEQAGEPCGRAAVETRHDIEDRIGPLPGDDPWKQKGRHGHGYPDSHLEPEGGNAVEKGALCHADNGDAAGPGAGDEDRHERYGKAPRSTEVGLRRARSPSSDKEGDGQQKGNVTDDHQHIGGLHRRYRSRAP